MAQVVIAVVHGVGQRAEINIHGTVSVDIADNHIQLIVGFLLFSCTGAQREKEDIPQQKVDPLGIVGRFGFYFGLDSLEALADGLLRIVDKKCCGQFGKLQLCLKAKAEKLPMRQGFFRMWYVARDDDIASRQIIKGDPVYCRDAQSPVIDEFPVFMPVLRHLVRRLGCVSGEIIQYGFGY